MIQNKLLVEKKACVIIAKICMEKQRKDNIMSKSTEELVNELENAKDTTQFEEFLKRNEAEMHRASFGDCVLKLCAKYERTPSSLQPQIAISKSQFYSLLNGTRNPSKESVIKIAFGLNITKSEINELLQATGFHALDPRDREDAIIIFGLENKKDVGKIDELLREYHSKYKLLDKE